MAELDMFAFPWTELSFLSLAKFELGIGKGLIGVRSECGFDIGGIGVAKKLLNLGQFVNDFRKSNSISSLNL